MAVTAGVGWGQQDEQQGFCQLPQAFFFLFFITQPGVQQKWVLCPITLFCLPENRAENNLPENKTDREQPH